jgi:hypothetical protein
MLYLQEYIKHRIRELTQDAKYMVRFKHLILQPNQELQLKAGTSIYLITDLIDDVRVESDTGLFDIGSNESNEQIYEHRGTINIENLSNNTNHLPLIQFVEKNTKYGK